MRVVETEFPVNGPRLYTVIGAVGRSGVFLSEEKSLPLWQLLEAAGGVTDQAAPSLRVIRHEAVRFQVLYDSKGVKPADLILPGDIVVVPRRSMASDGGDGMTVPIACVGLLDRPLVLPLDPRFSSIADLVRLLIQSPELARTARIIDPYGEQSTILKSGSIVLFNRQFVDRAPLQQPGALLPPVIDISKSGSEQSATSPAPEIPAPAAILSASNQQQSELPPPASPPMLAVSTSMAIPALNREKETFPALPDGNAAPIWNTTLAGTQPALPPIAPRPVSVDETAARPELQSAPEEVAEAVPLREILEPSAKDLVPASAVRKVASSRPVASDPAPLPPVEERIATPKIAPKETLEAVRPTTPTAKLPEATAGSPRLLLPLTIAILMGTMIGIGLPYLRSEKRKAAESQNIQLAEPELAIAPSAAEIAAAPEVQKPSPKSSALQTVLSRSAPLIEEPVVIPSQWPLHGKVIGHRRIILNMVHETPPAPHFAISEKSGKRKSQLPAASARERELRQTLRDHIRQQSMEEPELGLAEAEPVIKTDEAKSRSSSPASQPILTQSSVRREIVPPAPHAQEFQAPRNPVSLIGDDQQFDIVLPPHPAPKLASSPLERALRTLASEKRG
jgi:hypothetical protein